jgi:hypothetical protein
LNHGTRLKERRVRGVKLDTGVELSRSERSG